MAEYVLLPERGLRADENQMEARETLLALENGLHDASADSVRMMNGAGSVRVLDSLAPHGAKLIECRADVADALRDAPNGLRVAPVVYYYSAVVAAPRVALPEGTADVALSLAESAPEMVFAPEGIAAHIPDIRPRVSDTRPRVSNTRPRVSNTRPRVSDTRPGVREDAR